MIKAVRGFLDSFLERAPKAHPGLPIRMVIVLMSATLLLRELLKEPDAGNYYASLIMMAIPLCVILLHILIPYKEQN